MNDINKYPNIQYTGSNPSKCSVYVEEEKKKREKRKKNSLIDMTNARRRKESKGYQGMLKTNKEFFF
jgi:hypothetical protein